MPRTRLTTTQALRRTHAGPRFVRTTSRVVRPRWQFVRPLPRSTRRVEFSDD